MSDIMTAVRNIAVKEGYIHPAFLRQMELINTQGKIYETDEFDNRRRERVGLPHLPLKNEAVGKVLDSCGITKLLVSEGGS
jgi:heterodisulfide reductase subunit C